MNGIIWAMMQWLPGERKGFHGATEILSVNDIRSAMRKAGNICAKVQWWQCFHIYAQPKAWGEKAIPQSPDNTQEETKVVLTR